MKTKKIFFSGAALTLGVAAGFSSSAFAVEQCPVDILIDGGVAGHYATLQEAVDNAGDGIIKIADACIVESPVTINKKVHINGDNKTVAYDATGQGGYKPILNMTAGSAGSTIEGVYFDYKGDGEDDAIIYFDYGFDGSEEKVTTITGNSFIGNGDNGSGIIATYNAGINNLVVSGNSFYNLKYGMYFNSLNDAAITGNLIEDIKYNAINIAGDHPTISSENIKIVDNVMTNIATANYNNIVYASGVNIGANADKIKVNGNTIVMAEGENETKDIALGDAQKDIDIEGNGDYVDLAELEEVAEEVYALDLDKYAEEGVSVLRDLFEEAEYYLGLEELPLYNKQGDIDQLALNIRRAISMLELKTPDAPDTGVNQLIKDGTVASVLAYTITGALLALVLMAFLRKAGRR